MDLLKRREEIIAEHKAQEKYDPHWSKEAQAGRAISARPIAFLCDDEVVVVGEDVTKIIEGLKPFVARAEREAELAKNDPVLAEALKKKLSTPIYAHALAKCSKAVHAPVPAEIRVPQQTWNAYLYSLNEQGINVVLTDGTGA